MSQANITKSYQGLRESKLGLLKYMTKLHLHLIYNAKV